jgi:formylglycine-generating enzyme required for sulfatase activity/3',5'-cyclic AMP phosphodiesterase CpdA
VNDFKILHLSDFHVRIDEGFDRSVVLDPLLERAKMDFRNGLVPEIVIVSGDIAYSGVETEYAEAKKFFDSLLTELSLPVERIFFVPGNHDLCRKRYRPSETPRYNNMKELNDELENETYRADLLKGMNDYFVFIERNYPHLKPLHGRLVPFAASHKAQCGKRIGLVGLNSAWMSRKSPDREEVAIGEYQIKNARKALNDMGLFDLVIAVSHHPLEWLWLADRKICRQYLNHTVFLSGHLHETDNSFTMDMDGDFYQFQAGGAYSRSECPCRYHYISFDWAQMSINLNFRKFDQKSHKWALDGETGDDGKKRFNFFYTKRINREAPLEISPEIPETYVKWLNENYSHVDAEKLYGKGDAFPISLPEIFIPLYSNEISYREKDIRKQDGLEGEAAAKIMEKEKPVDLETLIVQHDGLLVEGEAGSGKTTLLKHVAWSLAQQSNIKGPLSEMHGSLPVLIFLKDLKEFFMTSQKDEENHPSFPSFVRRGFSVEEVLTWYFRSKMGNTIQLEAVQKFLRTQKVLFMLDGLDEIEQPYRDEIVNKFCDFRIVNHGTKVVFTGRRHGMEGAAVKRLEKSHVEILHLNWKQVGVFTMKWFSWLYPGSSGKGGKTAEAMIGAITDHDDIKKLVESPLMLTAVCILYHDNNELPEQRAELYKKFVENLIYRRFKDREPQNVHEFLKNLAFFMHESKKRGVDKSEALSVLKKTYLVSEGETNYGPQHRIENLFDDIESNCGLLKLENGQFSFWHLTFQEFLAASYLVDNNSNYVADVESYWKDDWFKEMLELYVGYLSIDQKQMANNVVASALKEEKGMPCNRWLLGGEALVDIHKDRRMSHAVQKAIERMLHIVEKGSSPAIILRAGEVLGRLGDSRNLKEFVKVKGGKYELENIGEAVIGDFEIGKYPVVNQWFEEFYKAGGYKNMDFWSQEGKKWLDYTKIERPAFWDERKWKCPNSPVVGVSWYEADAFCKWLTASDKDGWRYFLPDENQWQAAAAGEKRREYPWEGKWDKTKCNNSELGLNKTSPVGIFLQGNTPEGIADMAGNVWEWTISDYHSKKVMEDFLFDEEMQKLWDKKYWDKLIEKLKEKDHQLPVLRGGSWINGAVFCRCASRCRFHPSDRYVSAGFRCARTLKL